MNYLGKDGIKRLELIEQQIRECRLCPKVNHSRLYSGKYRKGQKYFFVGAAPWNLAGPEEAFMVGKAAANFDIFIGSAGILRSECFTTNAVAHIPVDYKGKSRQPDITEIANCSRYLKLHLNILEPKLVIALGGAALHALEQIAPTKIFSVTRSVRKLHEWYDRYLMVCTHPSPMAVSFRQEADQIEDYKAIKEAYDRITGNE